MVAAAGTVMLAGSVGVRAVRRLLLGIGLLLVTAGVGIAVARVTSHSVDGIGCDFTEGSGYHIHAHLTIVVRGHARYPPAGVGFRYEHLCLYWLHTHDASGVIHIEAPQSVVPTLGQFFDIWGEPLRNRTVWQYHAASTAAIRTYVGRKRFLGDPRTLRLRSHTRVTIEIGPPYISPPGFDFGTL